MSALSILTNRSSWTRYSGTREHTCSLVLSEGFWFTTSLLLFLAMGPFSALAALAGVISLAGKVDGDEPATAE